MEIELAVTELQRCDKELLKQKRKEKLRTILKIFLVGYLIGKNAKERLSELNNRRESALKCIKDKLSEVDSANREITTIDDSGTILNEINRKQLFSQAQKLEKTLAFLDKNRFYDKFQSLPPTRSEWAVLCSSFKRLLAQEDKLICAELSKITTNETYLIYSEKERLKNSIASYEQNIAYCELIGIIGVEFSLLKRETQQKIKLLNEYNSKFIEDRKKAYSKLFKRGNFELDDEQKTAIITDDKYNLVVAAAGSGKTEVLITRIAYLTQKRPDQISSDRILAIAYQKEAKDEIKKRLENRFCVSGVNVRPFHKLGKDIVEMNRGRKFSHTDIIDENKKLQAVKKLFADKMVEDKLFYHFFLNYVYSTYFNSPNDKVVDKEAVVTLNELENYVAIDGRHVNSRAEKEILDFLLTHKISGQKIKVENEPDTAGWFRPDFRLTDFDIFIEHWGLTKNGEVPRYFNVTTKEYQETMENKKRWFQTNNKLLVETYAYEYQEDKKDEFIELLKERIIEKLKEKYDKTFVFSPIGYDEIIELVWAPYKNPTPWNISYFIKNAKIYGLTPDMVLEKLKKGKWTPKQLSFGLLSLEIYRAYEKWLDENNGIDFEDMIDEAVKALREDSHLCHDLYDHILIDEYQDISAQRNKLIELLMERNQNCKLFCVGDDWQSIMGFAGSNVNFFVDYDKYFPNASTTKITTNYRSQKIIVTAGAALIRNNNSSQIEKNAISSRPNSKKIKVISSNNRKEYEKIYFKQTAEDCVDRIIEYINNGTSPNDILVLSRYKFQSIINFFVNYAEFRNIFSVSVDDHPRDNQIRLMTAHKSKGLQAKVVFILNVTKGRYGFPCELEDSSIFEVARENYPKQKQIQEERRLFYVAMTRAMEELIIYTWEPAESQFLKEIAEFTIEEPLYYWKKTMPANSDAISTL